MVDYDFIEIGAYAGGALIETATDSTVGVSIEPIKEYLDRLPNKPNVIKLNVAMVTDEDALLSPRLYYIEPLDIKRLGLAPWLSQCNRIGRPHDFHNNYTIDLDNWHKATPEQRTQMATQNLVRLGIVKSMDVVCCTYSRLMQEYNIGQVKLLKIDIEGYDCQLLQSIMNYYESRPEQLPEKIQFEANGHTDAGEVQSICSRLSAIGYFIETVGPDIIATLETNK